MSEWKALVEAARAVREQREPCVSALVVRVRGSSYRRPGARMLASGESWLAGSISGGCLERDVLTKGLWRTREQPAVLVDYDQANDERSGSGCRGIIDMLVERADRASPCDPFTLAERCLRDERVAVLVTVFRSRHAQLPAGARIALSDDGWQFDLQSSGESVDSLIAPLQREARLALERGERAARTIEHDGVEALLEPIVPPPHLFVFGSGHDTLPVVSLVRELGWSVSVWDAQPRFSARERLRAADHYMTGSVDDAVSRLARCVSPAALVMGHHYEQDVRALNALLRSAVDYIGVLGPRSRTDEMLSDCASGGLQLSEVDLARVYAPVGLQLGAETPSEIALSIIAEIKAVLSGAAARTLRTERGRIHVAEPSALPLSAAAAPGLPLSAE